jgi:hypothetical protein
VALCVRDDAGAPAFQVADNGKGFDARPGWLGAGFPGMADRLGALEGSVRLESAPRHGTMGSGTVPVSAPAADARSASVLAGQDEDREPAGGLGLVCAEGRMPCD